MAEAEPRAAVTQQIGRRAAVGAQRMDVGPQSLETPEGIGILDHQKGQSATMSGFDHSREASGHRRSSGSAEIPNYVAPPGQDRGGADPQLEHLLTSQGSERPPAPPGQGDPVNLSITN